MSELVDRLDVLLLEAEELDAPMECDEKTKRIALGLLEISPELRALVLRLQEERDREFEIATGYWERWQEVEQERDALLEALKDAKMLARQELAWETADRLAKAIANVREDWAERDANVAERIRQHLEGSDEQG